MRSTPVRQISVGFLMCTLLVSISSLATAEDLTLKSGKVYKNIGKIKDEGDRIKVPYDEGQVMVPKIDVPVEFLEKHGISTSAKPVPKPTPAAETKPAVDAKNLFDKKEIAPEESDIDLTIASILGNQACPVELRLLHYEKNSFICEGVYFEKEVETQFVQTGINSFTKQPIVEKRQVEVWKPRNFGHPNRMETSGRLRVFGLPQTLVGEKVWKGQLWLGGEREATIGGKRQPTRGAGPYMIRDAFTSRELAVQYMKEHGVGNVID